jgi:predicted nucleotidyltransferase
MTGMGDPREAAADVSHRLAAAFGARLRSVLLYGSAARGEYVPGRSDLNVLVLLDAIEPAQLAAAAPQCREVLERHGALPLLMSRGDWARASDAFAIEVADMQDAHVVLHGEDPVGELSIDASALRLQAERELRGKLIRLHTAMLLAGDDAERLGELLVAALPAVATYLRAALRLAGRGVPGDMAGVLRDAAALVGVAAEPLLRVHTARTDGDGLRAGIDDPIVRAFDDIAQRTAAFIDTIKENGG